MRIWFDGILHDGPLPIAANDRGLTLGDGIFETLLVRDGIALWRFEHLQRMADAAKTMGLPFISDDIENALDGVCHGTRGSHSLRLTLSRGAAPRGLADNGKVSTLIATLTPFDEKLRFQPVSLVTSSIARNEKSPSSRLKTLSYVDEILAAREAVAVGIDDALMLNTKGRVACSTIGNVFLWIGDRLVTPSLEEGVLPGIMRGAVLRMAKSLGIKSTEKRVTLADLAIADRLFVTNSLRLLRPVSRLDDRKFPTRRHAKEDAIIAQLAHLMMEQLVLS
jgi:branched-chain amino acid aminotransferase